MAKSVQKQVLKQQQKLTPQQIMAIKLLEVPAIELEKRIEEELEKNPLLEEGVEETIEEKPEVHENGLDGDLEYANSAEGEILESGGSDKQEDKNNEEGGFAPEDFMNDPDEFPEYKLYLPSDPNKGEERQLPYASYASFKEDMEKQLELNFDLTPRQKVIAQYILGNLDDDGYLRRDLSSIADDIAFKSNMDVGDEEVEEVLKIVQRLEPAGIAARDLKECLLLQLERKIDKDPDNVMLKVAYDILEHYFDELGKKHYEKIISKAGFSEEELEKILEEIRKLNPKPGLDLNETVAKNYNTITPDFILDIDESGEFIITLNDKNAPVLRISPSYLEVLDEVERKENKSKEERELVKFMKQKKNDAEVFISALAQRQNTMMKIMRAIAEYQRDYFRTQDEKKIKPMILKDIAEITGFDVSTVSRVVSNKYVQTPFGIISLKSLFSDKLQTSSGEEVSTKVIKEIIKEIIDSEDKKKPYSDDKIAKILKNKGYKIARRTVAKYREQMDIPDSRLRKEL